MTEARPVLSEEAFGELRALLRKQCGLKWHSELKEIVERRLGARVEALRLPGFEAYGRYLQKQPEELELALELLLTRETYFFREPRQLEVFVKRILPMLLEQRASEKSLRIWSAGCSTGEEPYTLAMLLSDDAALGEWNVMVHGTDISRRAIQQAERGEYGAASLRATSEERRRQHFAQTAPQRFSVRAELKAKVTWSRLNLIDSESVARMPPMDVIFCRNVLIYFDDEHRQRVLRSLHAQLRPGGFLVVGTSENLLRAETNFRWLELDGELCYQKVVTVTGLAFAFEGDFE